MNQLVQLVVRQLSSAPGKSPLLFSAGALMGRLASQSKGCLNQQFHSSLAVVPCRGVATTSISHAVGQEPSASSADSSEQPTDREPSPEAKHRARMLSVATGAACAFFGGSYILYRQLSVRAEEGAAVEVNMYT